MYKLHDLKESKVWQEAHQSGIAEGVEIGSDLTKKALVLKCLARGMSVKEIADLMGITAKEVRRLAK